MARPPPIPHPPLHADANTPAVDAGKSSMLGVLVKGDLDDGRGKARVNLFRHKHEMETGRTSSVGMEIMGFDSVGKVVASDTPGREHARAPAPPPVPFTADAATLKASSRGRRLASEAQRSSRFLTWPAMKSTCARRSLACSRAAPTTACSWSRPTTAWWA